jgi:hypothetical protein
VAAARIYPLKDDPEGQRAPPLIINKGIMPPQSECYITVLLIRITHSLRILFSEFFDDVLSNSQIRVLNEMIITCINDELEKHNKRKYLWPILRYYLKVGRT